MRLRGVAEGRLEMGQALTWKTNTGRSCDFDHHKMSAHASHQKCLTVVQRNNDDADNEHRAINLDLQQEPWWMKLIPFFVFLPTGVSLFILTLHVRLYKISSVLYEWSTSSRVLTQVVIHILASALSALLVFPICTIVSQWTRHRLSEKGISLDTLRVWTAVIQTRTDWNLPWTLKLTTLLFLAFSYLPAVLWAGALTPVITLDEIKDISLSGKATVFHSSSKHPK